MSHYNHLTQEQRYYIECSRNRGVSRNQIAQDIGVHPTTVGRELNRNEGQRGYRHQQAQHNAQERAQSKHGKRISDYTWALVEHWLGKGFSPEAISGRMELEGYDGVSYESIYLYVYADKKTGGTLHTYLVSRKPRRKKRSTRQDGRGQIKDKVSIDLRPAVVDELGRFGDWEADTVVGKNHQGVIVTINERLTGVNLAIALPRRTKKLVAAAIEGALMPIRHLVHTITVDNGKEFADHQDIASTLECDVYFAHPYSSWERGRNENSNGRLRRFFPKGTSFENITQQQVDNAVERMLDTPRKMLGFKTPREAFMHHTGQCVTNRM
ncbi:MAG: IS30 family transposase [Abditibacteriaceae bacterium]